MTPEQMRKRAAELRERAEKFSSISQHANDYAPGSYITGGSGRTRAQNRATERGLEKTIKYAKMAIKCREDASRLEIMADYNDPEQVEKREQAREAAKWADKKAKAQVAALPLVNDPAASLHITTEEWNKTHRDYKDICSNGKCRYRSMLRNSSLQSVYLTDKPTKVISQ